MDVAADYEGKSVVYRSTPILSGDRVTVDSAHGTFVGALAGQRSLAPGKVYYVRVRQGNAASRPSDWSRWHQGFRVR